MPVYVDISRCIGCRSCEVACQREHNGISHIEVGIIEDLVSVPLVCRHCEEPTCVMACSTGALTQEGERIAFDLHKCSGCGICSLACPFGVIWSDKYSHKCDLCFERGSPVCVATCPANALSIDQEEALKRARSKAAMAAAQGIRK